MKDGIALDALKGQHCAPKLDHGRLVGDDLGEGVGEHGHQNGQEQGVAQEGKGDHQGRSQHDVEADRLLDSGSVQTEPDPQHPFEDRGPVQLLGVDAIIRADQPLEREQEARKAPEGQKGEDGKVLHHGVEGDEDDVVGHEVEGHPRHHDGCGDAEDVQAKPIVQLAEDEVVDASHQVRAVDPGEGDVKKRPQVLRVHFPPVLNDGGKLLEHPSGRVDAKDELPRVVVLVAVDHGQHVEAQQDHELEHLDEVPGARDNQAVVVQQRRLARIIERDGPVLVVVRQDVHEGQGRVDDLAVVDGVHGLLARRCADEQLALRDDGKLQRRELPLVAAALLDGPLHVAAAADDILRGALERVEPFDQNVGEEQSASDAGVVFVEAPDDSAGHELAQNGTSYVYTLMNRLGLLAQELDAVGEKTVN